MSGTYAHPVHAARVGELLKARIIKHSFSMCTYVHASSNNGDCWLHWLDGSLYLCANMCIESNLLLLLLLFRYWDFKATEVGIEDLLAWQPSTCSMHVRVRMVESERLGSSGENERTANNQCKSKRRFQLELEHGMNETSCNLIEAYWILCFFQQSACFKARISLFDKSLT